MPEVVYPKPDESGKERTWGDVFHYLPDECDDWATINSVLENIAMFNRFGCDECGKFEEHREHYLNDQYDWFKNYVVKSDSKDNDERKKILWSYGMYIFYANEVYKNLGGAYREYKR